MNKADKKETHTFVVFGSTGEYEDYTSWAVCVFMDETDAAEFVSRANLWLSVRGWLKEENRKAVSIPDLGDKRPEFDLRFRCDYTGTKYFYDTVPLKDKKAIPVI